MGCVVQGSNPSGVKIFYTHPDWPWGPTQPPVQWIPGLLPGVKQPGHGIDHPLPTTAKAMDGYRYTCIPPLDLYVLFYGELYSYLLYVPFLPPLHLRAMVCKYSYNFLSTLCSSVVPLFLTLQLSNLNASHNPQTMETSKNKTHY